MRLRRNLHWQVVGFKNFYGASVEPSSMMISSKSWNVCAKTESMAPDKFRPIVNRYHNAESHRLERPRFIKINSACPDFRDNRHFHLGRGRVRTRNYMTDGIQLSVDRHTANALVQDVAMAMDTPRSMASRILGSVSWQEQNSSQKLREELRVRGWV
jgi:hypothetical protein